MAKQTKQEKEFTKDFEKLVEIAGGSQELLAEYAGASGQSTVGMWLKNCAISRAGIKALRAHRKFKNAEVDWAILAGL